MAILGLFLGQTLGRLELPSSQQHLNCQGLPSHIQHRVATGCDGAPTPSSSRREELTHSEVEGRRHVAKQPPPAHSAHLCFVHADEALVDLGPGGHSADVPELVGVLSKGARLHLKETREQG